MGFRYTFQQTFISLMLLLDPNRADTSTLKCCRIQHGNPISMGQELWRGAAFSCWELDSGTFQGEVSNMPCGSPWWLPFLHPWAPAQSPLTFLAVQRPGSSRMMIYSQLQTGFVNMVMNEEQYRHCIPLASLLNGNILYFSLRGHKSLVSNQAWTSGAFLWGILSHRIPQRAQAHVRRNDRWPTHSHGHRRFQSTDVKIVYHTLCIEDDTCTVH